MSDCRPAYGCCLLLPTPPPLVIRAGPSNSHVPTFSVADGRTASGFRTHMLPGKLCGHYCVESGSP